MNVLETAYRDNRDGRIRYLIMEDCIMDTAKQWMWDVLHIPSSSIIYMIRVDESIVINIPNTSNNLLNE